MRFLEETTSLTPGDTRILRLIINNAASVIDDLRPPDGGEDQRVLIVMNRLNVILSAATLSKEFEEDSRTIDSDGAGSALGTFLNRAEDSAELERWSILIDPMMSVPQAWSAGVDRLVSSGVTEPPSTGSRSLKPHLRWCAPFRTAGWTILEMHPKLFSTPV